MALCNCHNCRFVLPELLKLAKQLENSFDGDDYGQWKEIKRIQPIIENAERSLNG